jgi:mxaJ protein
MGRGDRSMRKILAPLFLLAFATTSLYAEELRVCADPNNLPFSNREHQGFENRIIELVARELRMQVRYVWWAQRRGNVRSTLNRGECDVIPGVASGLDMLGTTRPYYRSGYVFVSRRSQDLQIRSLDDPRLHTLTIGVQMVGDDGANTPPAHALARRGIFSNVRGYMLYGDYAQPNPPSAIVDAVARGDIDIAIAWGPMAGYFAKRDRTLMVTPVSPWLDGPQWPMVFDVSMGVRKDDRALRRRLNGALAARRVEIETILRNYGTPLIFGSSPASPP